MSTTTESAGLTAGTTGGTTEATTGSWEQAVKRQQVKIAAAAAQRGGAEAQSGPRKAAAHAQACRLEQAMVKQLDVVPTGDLLFHPNPAALHGLAPPAHAAQQHPGAPPSHFFPAPQPYGQQPGVVVQQQQHGGAAPQTGPAPLQPLQGLDLPGGAGAGRSLSPSPLEMFADPLFGGSSAGGPGDGRGGAGGGGAAAAAARGHDPLGLGLDDDELLRIPSPPPLPADWEAAPRPGLLFDFDQFDANKRHQVRARARPPAGSPRRRAALRRRAPARLRALPGGARAPLRPPPAPLQTPPNPSTPPAAGPQVGSSAPLVTVTTAMNPLDVSNPSDDYIWQILFAGENDAVPKRVTGARAPQLLPSLPGRSPAALLVLGSRWR